MAALVPATASQSAKRLLLIDDFEFGLQKSPIHRDKLAQCAPTAVGSKQHEPGCSVPDRGE